MCSLKRIYFNLISKTIIFISVSHIYFHFHLFSTWWEVMCWPDQLVRHIGDRKSIIVQTNVTKHFPQNNLYYNSKFFYFIFFVLIIKDRNWSVPGSITDWDSFISHLFKGLWKIKFWEISFNSNEVVFLAF